MTEGAPVRVCPGCDVPFGLDERHACPGYSWEPATTPAPGRRSPDCEALFRASGEVQSSSPLVSFLYLLMRDSLPVGTVDTVVTDAVKARGGATFSNGFLARHAEYLAQELWRTHADERPLPTSIPGRGDPAPHGHGA